jgi:DNA (cytosine-5)-methyltransferase 1
MTKQLFLDLHQEIIVDNFAGGGGASTGIELALGRRVDVAINHDPEAIAMHSANHPETEHHCESVWDIDPRTVKPGRPIGLLWLSPDCKHFSKAKGGKPVEKGIRGLAWVALRWAAIRQPRVIMLENVEEFVTWGPLVEGEDGKMRPCPKRKGREFNAFRNALQRHGYQVEHKELRACDYGAPTIRKRLFLIARRDGQPITWPAATHGDPKSEAVKAGKLKPWRTAAECIDWTLPTPSIFERARPLADATCRRIAKGIMRYVVNAAEPFIVNTRNGERDGQQPRTRGIGEPFWTVTAQGSQHALVAPVLTEHANASSPRCMDPQQPLRTICAQTKGGHHALVTAFLAKHYTGVVGADLRDPAPTVTSVDHNSLVTAILEKSHGRVAGASGANSQGTDGSQAGWDDLEARQSGQPATGEADHSEKGGANIEGRLSDGQDGMERPAVPAIGTCGRVGNIDRSDSGRDGHQPQGREEDQQSPDELGTCNAQRESRACPQDGAEERIGGRSERLDRTQEVKAFLTVYYGTDQDPRLEEPLHTVTTKDRYGLVTVAGQEYEIADIGLRMLAPRELFRAQGFPEDYIIGDNPAQGLALTKTAQVRMCGNSVCPPLATALVASNLGELRVRKAA